MTSTNFPRLEIMFKKGLVLPLRTGISSTQQSHYQHYCWSYNFSKAQVFAIIMGVYEKLKSALLFGACLPQTRAGVLDYSPPSGLALEQPQDLSSYTCRLE